MTRAQSSDTSEQDAIIRKIAALLARAEDEASSPAEVAHAMRIADKLMRRYNLSRDRVRLRQEELRRASYRFDRRDSRYANPVMLAISRLAQCHVTGERGREDHIHFRGLRVDVDYAEWLFRATWAALSQGWKAYQRSPQYKDFIEAEVSSPVVEHQFKFGFVADITARIKELAAAHADATGSELIELKNAIIVQAFGAANGTAMSYERLKKDLSAAYEAGAEESRKVALRQELDNEANVGRLAEEG
jgi:hypothetical protein